MFQELSDYDAAAPSAASSQLSTETNTLANTQNGGTVDRQSTRIRVQARDQFGNLATAGGATVVFSSPSPGATFTNLTYEGNGVYGVTFTSGGTFVGTATITTKINNQAVPGSVAISVTYSNPLTPGVGNGYSVPVGSFSGDAAAATGASLALAPVAAVSNATLTTTISNIPVGAMNASSPTFSALTVS